MTWTSNLNRLTGWALLVVAVLLVLSFVLPGAATGDTNPFDREEIDDYLTEIDDNVAVWIIGNAAGIALNAAVSLVAIAGLYILLRDRDRPLALVGLLGILAGNIASMASLGANLAMVPLAEDFLEGGAEGVDAGDAGILELARALVISTSIAGQIGFTAVSVGIGAFGAITTWAREGAVTPPRWQGWLALLAGAAGIVSWLIALADGFFVLFIIAGIAQLAWVVALGVWLLMHSSEAGSEGAAA